MTSALQKSLAFFTLNVLICASALVPAPVEAQLQAESLSPSLGTCRYYNPIPVTNGQLPTTSSIQGLVVPPNATYACAYPGGGGYQFFDASGSLINATTGGLNQPTRTYDSNLNSTGSLNESCNFSRDWAPFFSVTCWGRLIGAVVVGAFLSIGVAILQIAGYLFNFLLNYTIVGFSTEIYARIKDAIEIGWTAFRDIANILIIGMFTFIAISIILGEKTFGQKKLIAKVLIIAVLINFSLLFTKMIIDASNFTATQFYKAALEQVASPSAAGASVTAVVADADARAKTATETAQSSSNGIAGQFMQAIGITGAADSIDYVRGQQERTKDGFKGMMFGFLALVFFLGAAAVLFYGSFLLISRAVLLIFLMVTSSLAFASYLIPSWETSSYGWKTWWNSLLKSAVFAPILMLFLWITLMISQRLALPGSSLATLGAAGSNPEGNIAAVFSYLMILGLLFLSFKLSSSFAGKIAGFNFAQGGVATALGLGSRLAGFGLQRTLGREYAKRSSALGDKIKTQREFVADQNLSAWARQDAQKRVDKMTRQKGRADWIQKQNFNIAQSKLGDIAAKQTGASSWLSSGDKKDNFEADAKKKAEAAATRAEGAYNLTQGEQNKLRDREQYRLIREQKLTAEASRDAAQQQVLATEQQAQNEKTRLQNDKTAADRRNTTEKARLENLKQTEERNAQTIETQAKTTKDILEKEVQGLMDERSHAPTASHTGIDTEIANRRGLQAVEDDKIKRVHAEVKKFEEQIQAVGDNMRVDQQRHGQQVQELDAGVEAAKQKLEAEKSKVKEFDDKNSPTINRIAGEARTIVQEHVDTAKAAGAAAAQRYGTNPLARLVGMETYGGKKAKGTYEEKQSKSAGRKALEDAVTEMSKTPAAGTPASVTPPPPAAGGTGGHTP
ncbi:hypothetical protein A2763_00180 [Candidatus Kaiserbacteria bacterium RIFCSPHIGHO2_01_FULL_54_36]|uniref:Uncharacterized protein n=1 Tax=Candidatus Kaiserbacteria bacterium RIFCSPHIGHO2_01_FULL_54_36 TaxID=1798482 RepID=A0A1F6CPC3_9BACT|nr:MAG: hypothetical protein A2763_00180 [Candidatus Kaiserbacteria bacterium RIFCSPHIGHO2_01_FULL_54_36]